MRARVFVQARLRSCVNCVRACARARACVRARACTRVLGQGGQAQIGTHWHVLIHAKLVSSTPLPCAEELML